MKKWLIRVAALITLTLLVLVAAAFWSDREIPVATAVTSNPSLKTIKPGWAGTPVDASGRFVNHEFPFLPKTTDLIRWKASGNPFKAEKQADTARLEVKDPTEFLSGDRDGILWLGHASFFIRLNGKAILLDPVFGRPPIVTTYVDLPSPIDKIKAVDYVLLSHDHRDHMDETTLREIAKRFPQAEFFGGLGTDDVFTAWSTPTNKVQSAGWFQQFETTGGVNIYFLPVRHWCRRGLFDTNKRLWGGYVIQSDKATVYFGGDSGYGRHYRETAELFPQIDYFLIGIGAYEPRWFMEPNHNNPADALKAFMDSRARALVPMHYGTFDLSDEPPSAPLRTLKAEAERAGVLERLHPLAINESIDIDGLRAMP
ncbi:MAG TPA: MBL fold metallo-hydrolase [Pyrinomonadaceae bacterium]|nr:MBL fold metallo-hydrolase [Pyrinomonadaceae bacterium]